MILKNKEIKAARKEHICSNCGCKIYKGDSYQYLYGAPYYGEKPYALKLCIMCDGKTTGGFDE